MASLRVEKRKDTGTLQIVGTVAGQRIRKAAGTSNRKLAQEAAATLEGQLLRTEWHGERRGSRSFGTTVLTFAEAIARRPAELKRLARLTDLIGEDTLLRTIDQDTLNRISTGRSPATSQREIITPLRAVLTFAAKRKWCDAPLFQSQPASPGRVLFLLPDEAERLVRRAAPHVRPLLLFLLGTGARASEAFELLWRDVDLTGARVIFWRTKNGKRRVAELPRRVCVSLAELRRDGDVVFRTKADLPYPDTGRDSGGQIRGTFERAVRDAGLDPNLTPHCLRHTWATWHYALHRDLLRLKADGGWGSVALVERYAHLMPAGHEGAIKEFLDCPLRLAHSS